MIYFTSDIHFGHENILKYTNRPYTSIKEHDLDIIAKYNSVVQDNDVCYFLGDIFFGYDTKGATEIIKSMKGTKVLVKGNHDKNKDIWYYSIGFDVVLLNAQIKLGQKTVNLSHYPWRAPWYKRLYWHITSRKHRDYKSRKYKNLPQDGNWLLHGHTHRPEKVSGNKSIHIGLDAWDCTPVSATKILELMNSLDN